jgi:stress response protein SCP2
MVIELESEIYSTSSQILSNSSIGQHVRHVIEFFECLTSSTDGAVLNYDNRNRNILIEHDKEFAILKLKALLNAITTLNIDEQIFLEADYGRAENDVVRVQTTIGRELSYNIEHAIHHMALIKIGLIHSGSLYQIPEDFGVASSTLKYRKGLQCAQ